MRNRIICLLAIIILTASPLSVPAQQSHATAELLTLDQAISLALRDNREVKNAQLGVGKAEDDFAAAQTYRLPKIEFNALAG